MALIPTDNSGREVKKPSRKKETAKAEISSLREILSSEFTIRPEPNQSAIKANIKSDKFSSISKIINYFSVYGNGDEAYE